MCKINAETNENLVIEGFELSMKEDTLSNDLDGNYVITGRFGCRHYINKDKGIEIVFSGFPDVLDKYVFTEIATTNPDYSFYGLHVEDKKEKAANINGLFNI